MLERLYKALIFIKHQLAPNGIFYSYTSSERQMCKLDLKVAEIFSTGLIIESLPKFNLTKQIVLQNLYHLSQQNVYFTFFTNSTLYPPDSDTNALIYSILLLNNFPVERQANKVFDKIIEYASEDGIAQVWLSHSRKQQVDAVVSVNVQTLAYLLGRENELLKNKDFIINHLKSGKYLEGTRYYHSPDAFLYFLVRLAKINDNFADLIYEDLERAAYFRQQITCYPLDLAHRTIVFKWLGIDFGWELEKLLNLQKEDGSLPIDAIFKLGGRKYYFGSKALTTAYFVQAITV